jgi:acylphosphatase
MGSTRYVVSGLVQGVGFRAAVSRCANSLGLTGYVRNNSDGTVTALAAGAEEKLQMFELMLRSGCGSLARVDRVDASPSEESPASPAFRFR